MPYPDHFQLANKAIQLAKNENYEEAITLNQLCLKAKITAKDYEGVAFCYDRLSGIYWRIYKQTTDEFQKLDWAEKSYIAAASSLDWGNYSYNRIRSFMRATEVFAQQKLHHQQLDEAEKLFKESLSHNITSSKILNLDAFIFCHCRLMYIHAKRAWETLESQENSSKALKHFEEAVKAGYAAEPYLQNSRDKAQLSLLSKISHDYVKCLENSGKICEAIKQLEGNLTLNRKLGDQKNKILILDKLASLHFHQENLKTAKDIFKHLLIEKNIRRKITYDHSRHMLGNIYDRLGEDAAHNHQFEKAKQYYQKFLDLSKMNDDPRKASEAQVRLGFLFIKISDYKNSYYFFNKGVNNYLRFLNQRDHCDFKKQLSDQAQMSLEEAKQCGKENYNEKASFCYANIWNEIMEKSKAALHVKNQNIEDDILYQTINS